MSRPTDRFEGGVSVDLGNYQTYNFAGHISGPLAEGLAARIAFRSENSDKGWQVSNTRGERQGEVDKLGIRGSLAIDPGPGTHFDLSVTWKRDYVTTGDATAGNSFLFSVSLRGLGSR